MTLQALETDCHISGEVIYMNLLRSSTSGQSQTTSKPHANGKASNAMYPLSLDCSDLYYPRRPCRHSGLPKTPSASFLHREMVPKALSLNDDGLMIPIRFDSNQRQINI